MRLLSSLLGLIVALDASRCHLMQRCQVHHRGSWCDWLFTSQVTDGARPTIAPSSSVLPQVLLLLPLQRQAVAG
jgi:hypothetical protein